MSLYAPSAHTATQSCSHQSRRPHRRRRIPFPRRLHHLAGSINREGPIGAWRMGLATRRLHHLHHQHDQQAQVAKMAEARMEACLAWLQSWLAWLACWEASLVAEDWSECLKKAMEPLDHRRHHRCHLDQHCRPSHRQLTKGEPSLTKGDHHLPAIGPDSASVPTIGPNDPHGPKAPQRPQRRCHGGAQLHHRCHLCRLHQMLSSATWRRGAAHPGCRLPSLPAAPADAQTVWASRARGPWAWASRPPWASASGPYLGCDGGRHRRSLAASLAILERHRCRRDPHSH